MDDAEAVARARAGDLDAYEVLVARYTALAHRTAVLFGAGDDAEDVVQEAFVKGYRRLRQIRGDAPFRAWLLAIVTNEARNLLRSRRRRAGLALRLAAREDRAETGPDLPGDAAVAAALAVAVLIAVVPPARAAVAHAVSDLLDFAGVRVRQGQPALPPSPAPLPSARAVGLDEARPASRSGYPPGSARPSRCRSPAARAS